MLSRFVQTTRFALRGVHTMRASRMAVVDYMNDDMFCMQCEQTRNGRGCSTIGVCGKTPEVAALQDMLVDQTKSIGYYAHAARQLGKKDPEIDRFILDALFSTLTNVNFDASRFQEYIAQAEQLKDRAKALAGQPDAPDWPTLAHHNVSKTTPIPELKSQARELGLPPRFAAAGDEEAMSLHELCIYGLKGAAAYAHHAAQLGRTSDSVHAGMQSALAKLANPRPNAGEMLQLALDIGKTNVEVMAMLDGAHTSNLGVPSPAQVRTQPRAGKAILVSGHDLNDLKNLLIQSEGKGVDIYTHGEMLPAHGYPELRKFKHLAGNFGSAWQNQKFEFSDFPGPVIMTTNCLIEPMANYKDRLYTRSVVGWPGCKHIENDDYSAVIQHALECEGFDEDLPPKPITVGFGHQTVLSVADKVLAAMNEGQLKHVFFIGGCDGTEGERNYFKELALSSPKESLILTAGCGKYRFNKHDFGTLGNTGLPRLLDVGQCNDAYGVVVIASALAKALNCGINDLPVSLAVSWFEQKAVAVLLSLLHLGVKNIHLGPKTPAFLTPAALNLLADNYQLKKIGTAKADLKEMLQPRA